ncbi:MAG: PocR ligand-binding domain-containing protein [Deltaproteobacteria bacterium]|nr:PocR ligand-binding domain-containing protein [Deltaproteobacteria bacterium]
MAEPISKTTVPGAPELSTGKADSVLQRKLKLSDMLELSSFTEVCQGFSELYRVGVKVYEEKGPKLVDIKAPGTDLCSYVFEFANGKAQCIRTAARVKDGPVELKDGVRSVGGETGGDVFSVPCFTGCRYLVMPVRHEGDVLGRVVFGPYVPDDLAALPPGTAAVVGQGFDVRRAGEMLAQARHAPEASLGRILGHFRAIIDSLVFAGQKLYLTSQVHIEATREAFREIESKNRELTATNERLRELDRLKSNFLATVSHELRTPLTSIIGYSEMLVQGMAGPINEEQDEYMRTILEKGESLLALISSILDLTQIEAGRMRLSFAPCDLGDIVKQAVSAVMPQAQQKRLQLDVNLAAGMERPSVDRDKLRQCLINLLANSVKFTPEGGRLGVAVLAEAPAGVLAAGKRGFTLVVQDTGIGIPTEQKDRIFESFYQVDQSSTRQYGGAGLGLAIVKSFVEAHGGKVRVDSEVGRYSRFTLVLPYKPEVPETEIDGPF